MFFPSLSNGLFSALDKEFGMPSAIILPSVVSAALDKQLFCRVPDGMHSVNILALGKSPVSGSVNVIGAQDLDVGQLHGCLPNIRKLE